MYFYNTLHNILSFCENATYSKNLTIYLFIGNHWQAPDLGTVLAAAPGVFASRWCEGDIAVNLAKGEMDATLIYDPFQAAGAAMLASAKGATAPASGGPDSSYHVLEEMDTGCVLSIESISPDHYARERSALLVKLFANLYCYNPEVCSGTVMDWRFSV